MELFWPLIDHWFNPKAQKHSFVISVLSSHWLILHKKDYHFWPLIFNPMAQKHSFVISSLFSLANSYLLLSFPSRIHHHKVFLLHFNLQIHMRSKYTSLLYAPPLLLSGWLLLLPDAYFVNLPLCYSSGRLLREASSSGSVAKMKAWKDTTSWRRCSGGGAEMTEGEDDAAEMVVVTNQRRRQR